MAVGLRNGPRLVLGQVGWDGSAKGGEIAAAQGLIETLILHGKLYTLDALHCQKTLQAALASDSDVLVQVKGNQATLLHDITAWPLRRSRRVRTTRTTSASITASRRAAPRCDPWPPGAWALSGQPLAA